ncbi:protein Aster-B isoform X3 [Lepeophtheirus salmonis]|nr:protein Aster-B-like isoform X3 [Lepeophtheirus salmonis]XP_040575775.1 protein Aster-B-like isoform X3 [Lepeophtheirus salmonis]
MVLGHIVSKNQFRRKITFEGAIDSGDFVTAIGTFLYYDENDNTLNGGMYSSNSEDSIMPASTQYLVRTELNDSEPKVSTPNPSISSSINLENRSLSSKSDLNEAKNFDSSKKAKKKSWYNAFYPNYKSVSEDFKKIFPSIPSDERLIAGYSCAIQKDILVHGRLYFTKKYLCFYAKILNWETQLELAWKDVVSISREKTAYVIPNAISIYTDNEKHFFASFASRERTFFILEKIWESAKADQEISNSEIWQLVHSEYGEELGLTSEDEMDYVCPWNIETQSVYSSSKDNDESSSYKKSSSCNKIMNEESLSENVRQCESNPTLHCSKTIDTNEKSTLHNNGSGEEPSNETSDSSEDFSPALSSISKEHTENRRKKKRSLPPPPVISIEDNLEEWSSKHVGKDMVDETLQMSVDSLFTHYFTNSKFFLAFHSSRKTSDIVLSPWSQKEDSEDKVRVTNFTISVTHPMGPKSSQVTETQVMKSESRPGYYYMIDVDTVNRGIPYADSFYVTSFFCLSRISDNESRVTIKSTINFKKTVWGILKSFIEKNALTGLEEFYGSLIRTLHAESEVRRSLSSADHNRKSSTQTGKSSHNSTDVSRTRHSGEPSSEMLYEGRDGKKSRSGRSSHFDIKATASNNEKSFSLLGSFPLKLIITLLIGLFLTNLLLFFKVWTLESKLSSASRGGSGEGSSASYSLNGYSSYYLFQEDLLKLSSLPSPQTKEEWIQLLQKQELIHQIELGKWIEMLEHAMSILRNTENSLSDLEKNLHPWTLNKFRPSLFDKKLKEHSFNRESHPEESEEGTFSSPPSLASSSSAPLKEDL